MSLQFENLVGKRETKENLEAVIIAEPSVGNFRMSPKVATLLDVTDGDNVTVQKAGDTVYIGKGIAGTPKVDENGNYVTDNRGRRTFEEGQAGFGALLREIQPGTNIFRFSNAAGWTNLGADGSVKKVYELGEPVEQSLNTGTGTYTTLLYPLVFVRDEEKAERTGTKKEDSESEVEDNAYASGQAVESPVSQDSDFSDEDL